jgi:hypothetical protein
VSVLAMPLPALTFAQWVARSSFLARNAFICARRSAQDWHAIAVSYALLAG